MSRQSAFAHASCVVAIVAATAAFSPAQSPCLEPNFGTPLGATDDWVSPPQALGFNFPFNGGSTNTVDISSNGFIWLNSGTGTGSRCCNGVEATFVADPACIAPLWTDLTPAATTGGLPGEVFFNAFASPQKAVITWSQLKEYAQDTAMDVQLQLFPDGSFTVVYGATVAISGHTTLTGITQGGGATPFPVDLTGSNPPSPTPTLHETFAAGTSDLSNRTLRFAPVGSGYIVFADRRCSGASANKYGTGCPTPPVFYELFTAAGLNDLSGFGIRLRPTGSGGYDVSSCVGCFNTSFTNNLLSGDDSLFTGLPLGFTIPVPGFGTTNTIDIDSNGRVGVGLTASDYTESVAEFLPQVLWAACWDDFNPASGGGVYFDASPGIAMVTWDQIPQYPAVGANTFQVQFLVNGDVIYAWQQVSDDALVGYSDGSNALDPGSIDLTATVPFISSGGGLPMTLDPSVATPRPVMSSPFTLEIGNVPGGVVGGALLIGLASLNLDLTGLGASGCNLYCTANYSLSFPASSPATSLSLGVVPPDPLLVGAELFLQCAAIAPGINPLSVVLTNGLGIRFNTF